MCVEKSTIKTKKSDSFIKKTAFLKEKPVHRVTF